MTYEQMLDYCESNRDEQRFCTICDSCSGACRTNLQYDIDRMEEDPSIVIFRGGRYGSCCFEVREEQ